MTVYTALNFLKCQNFIRWIKLYVLRVLITQIINNANQYLQNCKESFLRWYTCICWFLSLICFYQYRCDRSKNKSFFFFFCIFYLRNLLSFQSLCLVSLLMWRLLWVRPTTFISVMENKCLTTRPSQTCQLILTPKVPLFAKNQDCMLFISFLWRTRRVEHGWNFIKTRITCVLFMGFRHMVLPTRETPCCFT